MHAEAVRRKRGLQAKQDEARRKSAAKANTERGKNGIIHAMNNRDKSALALALAIVGGIAAGMRCDASVTVETPTQINPRPAAYTVKTYTEGSDPFDAYKALMMRCAMFITIRFGISAFGHMLFWIFQSGE